MKILFVCLGNICRSPMAEYLAKDFIKKNQIINIEIDSCGTANYHEGEFMHQGTDQKLSQLGIAHKDFVSKQITNELFNSADYVFVMDDSNYNDLVDLYGENNKIKKITDYCDLNYSYVPDPWYSHNFDQTYQILNNCITNFFNKLEKIK